MSRSGIVDLLCSSVGRGDVTDRAVVGLFFYRLDLVCAGLRIGFCIASLLTGLPLLCGIRSLFFLVCFGVRPILGPCCCLNLLKLLWCEVEVALNGVDEGAVAAVAFGNNMVSSGESKASMF
jgi:hypothetical protein